MRLIQKKLPTLATPRTGFVLVLALVSLAMATGATAAGKIYRTVDEYGNVAFTDVPPRADQSSVTVELDPLNSFETKTVRTPDVRQLWIVQDKADDPVEAIVPEYEFLRIKSPSNDATVRNNAGNLSVAATVSPRLQPGHSLRLLLDGSPQQTSRNAEFTLSNVDRGTHRLSVEIVDEAGSVLLTSEASVVHLMRYSAGPARATPHR
ncbi:MAG: DUF4124 domain-containing protein [Gammaproteobacteria bacterium]|nr:DUF4124 domain-containing protein [Gammaproteobacteria bacterium]